MGTPFSLESPDIAEYAHYLEGPWELEYEQLEGGDALYSTKGISVGKDAVYVEKTSRTIGVRGCLQPGMLLFSSPSQASRRGRFWGRSLESDCLVVLTSEREADVAMPNCDNIEVTVNAEEFRFHFRELLGREPDFLEGSSPTLRLPPPDLRFLEKSWRHLASGGAPPFPDFSLSRMVAKHIARGFSRQEKAASMDSRQLRRFRDCIALWEASDFEMNVAQICRRVGVSERTLGIWFQAQRQMSPHQFLRRRRLNLAHGALLASDPASVTVTEIAMRFGFHELGRFSGRYRKFFGELPSETLRKRSGASARQVKITHPVSNG